VVLTPGYTVAGVERLRAVVQEWSARSLRLPTGLGFAGTGRHDVGDVTYVVYGRDAQVRRGERAYAVSERLWCCPVIM
jgi:hypothetical protein